MNGSDGSVSRIDKLSLAGVLVTIGIVFGDIGTSPLYTVKAILEGGEGNYSDLLVLGALSCVFWTLTIQTTIKYISITLRADNKGEGGIFALFALMRKKSTWAAVLTMIGGSALLADGVITPAITVTSSIEGLRLIDPGIPVIPIVLLIFFVLFFIQQFGTKIVGVAFGPAMLLWFLMLGTLGMNELLKHPVVLEALNPLYAVRFLTEYPGGFVLLGAVFLCTTGAEALYSDLGHCGRKNIQVSWIFVKLMLILSYFGQGAWILMNYREGMSVNPFFAIMPRWFLVTGIVVATLASIIASQALISGSFTLISEAVSLNFWPKVRVLNPTFIKGQVYIPFVNWGLLLMCSLVVVFFGDSSGMEAAYGLAITITMIMTTLLLSYYLYQKNTGIVLVGLMLAVFLTVECSFLVANMNKFAHGGWFTILLSSVYFLVMFGWYFGRKIRNRRVSFTRIENYYDIIRDLRNDSTIPITATNLVYLIKANHPDQVESKVIYSIFSRQPKRANTYWLLHVNRVDDPNMFEYNVKQLIPGILIRLDLNIGFKIDPKINLFFREVIEDLVASGEINLESSYDSLRKHGVKADFKFVLIERIMSRDVKLTNTENFILTIQNLVRYISIPEEKALQLDPANTIVEKVPILLKQSPGNRIRPVSGKS